MLPDRFFLDSIAFYRRSGSGPPHTLTEEQHRVVERRFWALSSWLSAITIFSAIVGALAAYKAYTAARDQARIAKMQLQDAEEPNIIVTGIEAAYVNENGNEKEIQLNPLIKNSGTLPAKNLVYTGATRMCDANRISKYYFPKEVIDNDDSIEIAGQQKTRIILRHQLSRDQIADLRKGITHVYTYGIIKYSRAFAADGKPDFHVTRYCYGLLGLPSDISKRTALYDVFYCGQQTNCTDEGCGPINKKEGSCKEINPTPLMRP